MSNCKNIEVTSQFHYIHKLTQIDWVHDNYRTFFLWHYSETSLHLVLSEIHEWDQSASLRSSTGRSYYILYTLTQCNHPLKIRVVCLFYFFLRSYVIFVSICRLVNTYIGSCKLRKYVHLSVFFLPMITLEKKNIYVFYMEGAVLS